jgi:hypothetical protein
VSYNASVVKIYNAASSLVRFKGKNKFVYFEKRSGLHTTTPRCSCKFRSRWIGSRGRCYDHNFLRFLTIFGEQISVFLKSQCYDQNFAYLSFVSSQKRHFFAEFFSENIFKIITSVPGRKANLVNTDQLIMFGVFCKSVSRLSSPCHAPIADALKKRAINSN